MVYYNNINLKKKTYQPKTHFKTVMNGKSPNQRTSAKRKKKEKKISTLCSVHFPMYFNAGSEICYLS